MEQYSGQLDGIFQALNIEAISTSEIKISVLLGAAHTEAAVKTLHSLFGLDKA